MFKNLKKRLRSGIWIASWRILVCSVSYGKRLGPSYYDDDRSFCLILRFWKWAFMDHLFLLFLALGVWFSGCFYVYILHIFIYVLSIIFFASQLIFNPCKFNFFHHWVELFGSQNGSALWMTTHRGLMLFQIQTKGKY